MKNYTIFKFGARSWILIGTLASMLGTQPVRADGGEGERSTLNEKDDQVRPGLPPRWPGPRCRTVDLIVTSIASPSWDPVVGRTILNVTIRNVGAQATDQRIYVSFNDGRSQQAVITNPLGGGEARSVTLTVPYWVYQPDANFRITVDPVRKIPECNEQNNFRDFRSIG